MRLIGPMLREGSTRVILLSWLFLLWTITGNSVLAQNLSQAEVAKLQEVFNAGNALIGSGNFQLAAEKYSEAIAIAPSFPLPYINRGVAYLSLSKQAEALADADKALSLLESGSPLVSSADRANHSAIAYQVKGTVYQNRGDYRLALDAFSKSIELVPAEAKFWNSRGNAYRMLKEYGTALKEFDRAIELDPAVAMFYVNRASVHLKLKNIEKSLPDLEEALRIDKTDASAYYTRGNAFVELKKYSEALADYNQAILLKRKSEFFHGRARLYFIEGKFDLAVRDHSEALVTDPSNANAYGDRAVAYSRLGKYTQAIDDIRRALELKGESVLMRYTLGYLLYKTGHFSIAASEATKVIALAPKWRDAYLLRANSYAKLGNSIKAKVDSEAAAKLAPGGRPVEDFVVFGLEISVPEEIDK